MPMCGSLAFTGAEVTVNANVPTGSVGVSSMFHPERRLPPTTCAIEVVVTWCVSGSVRYAVNVTRTDVGLGL